MTTNAHAIVHRCHAAMCSVPVQPRFLMCRRHWALVPNELKLAVLRAYRPGQCDDKQPSREYLEAARRAINRVAQIEGFGEYYE